LQRADEALGAFCQRRRNRLPVLLVVALVDDGSLVVPPTEFRSFLSKGQCHPVREQGEDIPYMRPVLEGGPHVGSRSASQLVALVELNEENGPSISFLRDRNSQLVLRYSGSLQPALVAVLIGNHLEPVALVRDEKMMAYKRNERTNFSDWPEARSRSGDRRAVPTLRCRPEPPPVLCCRGSFHPAMLRLWAGLGGRWRLAAVLRAGRGGPLPVG
jgi:hypothetical protein